MNTQISKWKVGDDPQLIINFIKEVMKDLLPSYSISGWYTKEQIEQICQKYTPTYSIQHSFSFYDGKILNVKYKDVIIHFQKDGMIYSFDFDNISVNFYEDWRFYGETEYHNDSYCTERFNCSLSGFEALKEITGIGSGDITVVVEQKIDSNV